MTSKELGDLRRDFTSQGLSKSLMSGDPFAQFGLWLDEALASEAIDANAMTLSTVNENGQPSARVVLLKHFGPDGFCFYTNYESRKARDLAANPRAALHFFWAELSRQVAIHGPVEKTSREESEKYFMSRPIESRLSAWASNQSGEVESRKVLEDRVAEFRARYGDVPPLPDFWGGYRLRPQRFEFWQGRQNRLHDRIVYEAEADGWRIVRLAP
jgi:pyridoxamine 5'-phosphate oxidase